MSWSDKAPKVEGIYPVFRCPYPDIKWVEVQRFSWMDGFDTPGFAGDSDDFTIPWSTWLKREPGIRVWSEPIALPAPPAEDPA